MSKGGKDKQKLGKLGEQIAADFLIAKGYHIVKRNFSERTGETDIIAWHHQYHFGKTLCFIEVKYRSHNDGSAERSVGEKKQSNMATSARMYCLEHGIDIDHTPIQFEQVSIYGTGTEQEIFHYEIIKS